MPLFLALELFIDFFQMLVIVLRFLFVFFEDLLTILHDFARRFAEFLFVVIASLEIF